MIDAISKIGMTIILTYGCQNASKQDSAMNYLAGQNYSDYDFSVSQNESERTTSPWSMWVIDNSFDKRIAIGKDGHVVASIEHEPLGWLNAQFILQACNTHNTLVSALVEIALVLGYGSFTQFPDSGLCLRVDTKTIKKVHAALDLLTDLQLFSADREQSSWHCNHYWHKASLPRPA